MSTTKNPEKIIEVKEKPIPAPDPDPSHPVGTAVGAVVGAVGGHLAADAFDPVVETNYWRQNYKARPYYKEGNAFGDYEAAYRYGWENAVAHKGRTFEEAEKSHLAKGWAIARGATRHAWGDIREASRDAWNRVRHGLKT